MSIFQIWYLEHCINHQAHPHQAALYQQEPHHPHHQPTNKKSTSNHFVGVKHITELQDGSHTETLAKAL